MSFLGADTDELREAGQKCQEGKDTTDQVITYLRALIAILKAASFFSGGASAAYATYLETVVVPWLEKISAALGLFAKVLNANAQAQDQASQGESVDFGSLPTYTPQVTGTPTAVQPFQGTLLGDAIQGLQVASALGSAIEDIIDGNDDTGSGSASLGQVTGAGTTGAGTISGLSGSSTATPTSVGGNNGIDTGIDTGSITGSVHDAPPRTMIGDPGAAGSGAGHAGAGHAALGGGGALSGGGSGGGSGSGGSLGSGGSAGGGGLGSGSIDGGSSASNGSGLGNALTASHGSSAGDFGGTLPGADTAGTGQLSTASGSGAGAGVDGSPSYGAAAGIAGGAAALGLGGAALASKGSGGADPKIDALAGKNGRGSSGAEVTDLQERLTQAGYDTKGADGQWGSNTQAAYDAYRADHPVQVTPGSGYNSPGGYDYTQISGVRGNANVTPEFLRGVEGVAQRVGAKPEHLMAAMSFETGGSFASDVRNPRSSATGLIQFMDGTAKGLGTTTGALAAMSPTEQLHYVEKYFEPYRGRLDSLESVYTTILSGRPHEAGDVLFSQGQGSYGPNRELDFNHDGQITAAEATSAVQGRMGR